MSQLSEYFYEINIPFYGEQPKERVLSILEGIIYDGANEGEFAPEVGDKAALQIIDSIENFKLIDEKLTEKIDTISIFFFEDDFEGKMNVAQEVLKDQDVGFRLLKKPVEDWNQEWKKYYKPIDLDNGYKILPAHLIEGELKQSEIAIIPGQGFGTGEHSTTFLCLNLFLEKMNQFNGKECLDFGCGSGILGVGVIKWSDMKCDFMDIDPRALDNCVQNLVLNFEDKDLSNTKIVSRERFEVQQKYDLVFANILEHVLISEKESIDGCVKKDGTLILSGILLEQKDGIIEKYEAIGYQLEKEAIREEWVALRLKKQ
jgi:ribosomal protein L11 methyltransferase